VLGDGGKSVYFTGGSTATLTVPTNASVAFPTGTTILVLNNNSGALTISGAGVTFQLANGATGNRTVATKGMASLIKVATDTWWVTGPGVT
jgi:SpoU rRNA methylase family enzyme